MPDHLHLLVTLGRTDDLSKLLRLFKGRLAPALRQCGLQWQQGYYDHRLHAEEDLLPVFLYIFLNAYRAQLVPTDQSWDGFYCSEADHAWFAPLSAANLPFPEWLK